MIDFDLLLIAVERVDAICDEHPGEGEALFRALNIDPRHAGQIVDDMVGRTGGAVERNAVVAALLVGVVAGREEAARERVA